MSKLTYRDIPLILTAGAELSASRTGWWLKDKMGFNWYIAESDENQYLSFNGKGMERHIFAELFE